MSTQVIPRVYEYQFRDGDGKIAKGKIEATNESAVVQTLRGRGVVPLNVQEAGAGLNREINIGTSRVGIKDLALMSRQFATMIDAQLTMLRSLSILADQTENATLAKALSTMRNDIQDGSSLSDSMGKHAEIFPPLMINMVRAGEAGGFLDKTLLQVADDLEADVRLRGKVKSALMYPAAVLVIAGIAIVAMLTFIVPVFKNMFEQLGGDLPAPTQVLVFLSEQMNYVLPMLIIGTIGSVMWWRKYGDTPGVRAYVDPFMLKMPVFGVLVRKVAIGRFTRTIGALIGAGVPILQALQIVRESSDNVVIAAAVDDMMRSVNAGESLVLPLSKHPVFPPMVVQLMSVGEEAGELEVMCLKISQFYEEEVNQLTEALTSLMEPLMIAILGSVIGGMVIAMYLPIFKIFELLG